VAAHFQLDCFNALTTCLLGLVIKKSTNHWKPLELKSQPSSLP
jgi:hypothetical protein